MKIRYFEKRGELWIDFRDSQGGRRRVPTGKTTQDAAERAAPAVIARIEAALTAGAESIPKAPTGWTIAKSEHTFESAYKRGLRVREKWIEAKDKATLNATFEAIAEYWGADQPLSKANKEATLRWREVMLKTPGKRKGSTLSHSTINHRLSMLSVLLEVAELPPHGVKHLSVRGNNRVRRISDKEVDAMCEWLRARPERPGTLAMAALITVGLETAARQGELLGILWADVGEDSLTFRKTKNGKTRTIPLTMEARRVLEGRRYVAGGPFFDLSQDRCTALWDLARDALGLADDHNFVFHGLRHEKLSRLADSGANAMVMQTYAGHDSVETTQRYTHASMGAMRGALEREQAFREKAKENTMKEED